MDNASAGEAAAQLAALRGDISALVSEVGQLQGVARSGAEASVTAEESVLTQGKGQRARLEKPVKTESEVHAAVAGLSELCETTLKHCQETAGTQAAVAAKLAELQEETSVVAAALHRLRGIFQGFRPQITGTVRDQAGFSHAFDPCTLLDTSSQSEHFGNL
eukprot:s1089_g22.t1